MGLLKAPSLWWKFVSKALQDKWIFHSAFSTQSSSVSATIPEFSTCPTGTSNHVFYIFQFFFFSLYNYQKKKKNPLLSLFQLGFIYLVSMCIGIINYTTFIMPFVLFLTFSIWLVRFKWHLLTPTNTYTWWFYFSFPFLSPLPLIFWLAFFLLGRIYVYILLFDPCPYSYFSISTTIKYIKCSPSVILIYFPSHFLFRCNSSSKWFSKKGVWEQLCVSIALILQLHTEI